MDLIRNIPLELLFIIAMALVLLIQLVVSRLRRRAGSKRNSAMPLLVAAKGGETAVSLPAEPQVDLQRWGSAPPPPPIVGCTRGPHRFSRSVLFRDRRDLQKAIVVSVILQPCCALRPHTMD